MHPVLTACDTKSVAISYEVTYFFHHVSSYLSCVDPNSSNTATLLVVLHKGNLSSQSFI